MGQWIYSDSSDSVNEINNNILTVFHYIPLHSSPAGRKYGKQSGELTITDDISDKIYTKIMDERRKFIKQQLKV